MAEFAFDNRLALSKLEASYDSGEVLSAATDVIIWNNGRFRDNPTQLTRNNDQPYFGARPRRIVPGLSQVSGEAEHYLLTAVPTMATDKAPLDTLLQMMGMAKTVDLTPGSEKIVYNPISTGFASGAFWFEHASALYKLDGALASGTINIVMGQFLAITDATVTGLYQSPVSSGTLATPTFPSGNLLVPLNTNTSFSLGGTTLDMYSMQLQVNPNIGLKRGSESRKARYRGRDANVRLVVFQDDLANFNPWDHRDAHDELVLTTTVAEGATGGRLAVSAPAAQIISVEPGDQDGDATWVMELAALPSAGNDDFSLTYDYVV